MKRIHGVLGALALGLSMTASAASWTQTARACSAPDCRSPVRLFPVGAVPGDRIYFKLLVEDPGELTLRDADGRVIETEVRTIGGDRTFAPRAAVPPERTLTLTYALACQRGVPAQAPQTFTFKTVANDDQAKPAVNFVLHEIGTRWPGAANAEKFVRLAYDPPANSAQRHLQDIFVKVDGRPYFPGYWGSAPVRPLPLWSSDLELRTRCSQPATTVANSCGQVDSYAAGKHEVEIWSTIVGEGEQPHLKLTVDLACDQAAATPAEDAGAPCATKAQGEASAMLTQDAPQPSQARDEEQDTEAFGDDERDRASPSDDEGDEPLAKDDEEPAARVKAQSAAGGCALGSDSSDAPALFGLVALAALIRRRRA